ncbi:MAG: hypothetical protein ACFFD2_07200 [Promethearchaeota archaeon]
MEIIGYQSRVYIIQALPCGGDNVLIDDKAKHKHLINTSWLFDPFREGLTYGVEFGINKSFSWTFFMFSKFKAKAEELGEALLLYLREKYKGLDGYITIDPLLSNYLEIERPLYEINFQLSPPDSIKFQFLRKIINYYNTPHRKFDINIFVLWRKDDLSYNPSPFKYMVKFFISLNPNQETFKKSNNYEASLKAVLKYFITDMSIPPYMKVDYELSSPNIWKDVLMCKVFPNKNELVERFNIGPGQNVPNEILREIRFFKQENFDFDLPQNMPLPKPPILENRNVVNLPVSKDDPNYIYFGNKMIDGILGNKPALIEIDALSGHMNIFGKTRTGKSTLIKILIYQVIFKRPEVGILIINLVKPNLEHDFPMAKVYKFPSEMFKVPYIIYGDRVKKSITGTSKAFAACLGLKYVGPVIISETLQRCYQDFKEFPSEVNKFFDCVENNMKAQPWGPETQQTILTAFRRRVGELFKNPEIRDTLRLNNEISNNIPEWFTKWKAGELVILDLTKCDDKEQHLLTMFILQMVETLISFENNSNKLRYIINIDEAHRILGKSRDTDPESVEFIMKNNINNSFSNTIEECGGKGLGFINSEQRPYQLLDSAIDSARTKVLFRLGYPSNEIFTGNIKEREMLLSLPNRYALVINENERYLCKTAEDKDSMS